MAERVTKDTIILDVLRIDAETAPFFLEIGMHCLGCPSASGESIEQARAVHGVDADENLTVFEGCMPVEVMAKRGEDTLRFGPLKPVGFRDPRTDARPYAIVQLRQDNEEGTLFNMVGFQTNLKFGEQKRVFSLIPGLENASFLRYGVMHRNTYILSPVLLDKFYRMKENENIYFAGQMTGVEGYVESAGSGLVAGISAARQAMGLDKIVFPSVTMLGAMARYVSMGTSGSFVPMNANFGIIPSLENRVKGGKQARYAVYAERALAALDEFKEKYENHN